MHWRNDTESIKLTMWRNSYLGATFHTDWPQTDPVPPRVEEGHWWPLESQQALTDLTGQVPFFKWKGLD